MGGYFTLIRSLYNDLSAIFKLTLKALISKKAGYEPAMKEMEIDELNT
ncbi:hypothetical protein [Celerinatantimonas sp. MCCC 1A17872]